ncbi:class I glutamine amidotransferase-like protein [Cryphonectria parasitica EP155]|uniref:Class I glutamine amidotransferase-like protein n=1 Tax=Cryphonectria parasitica (strain ATCC 38755 / EP155) TaxID=660469 RepID=A0A9P4Y2N3_CRYP1|nr:class I glutamine amidotransferase-like protein [Cryphonectria parasitica EP155]KAF3765359.1 class I glutamine amidotransferase-like protein [Cryphonectria parasitica EP155]
MAFQHHRIRVAMLNADTSNPNTYANMGTFGDILHYVLAAAASRLSTGLAIEHETFDVVRGEYPASVFGFDAVMITASSASSYDDQPWIRTLQEYLMSLYQENSHIRIFGSCFGHHLICQTLLGGCGVRVEKHPNGWEVGVSNVAFTSDFMKAFSQSHSVASGFKQGSGRKMRLQFVHADQVVLPPSATASLPSPWTLVGSTEHCFVQGVYHPGRVLTLQGHFEFDKFEGRETMRIFGAEDNLGGNSLSDQAPVVDAEDFKDDGDLMAEMVVRFLAGEQAIVQERRGEPGPGDEPLTPRASMELQ